jgi:tetratricopeptide (TPR) repeat protein
MALSKKAAYLLIVLLAMPGCQGWQDKHTEGTVIGGAAGAGVGALVGSMTGSWAWGALIGMGTGAIAGYVIADHSGVENTRVDTVRGTPSEADLRRQEADRHFQSALSAKTPSESKYHLQRSLDLYPTPAAWNNLGTIYINEGQRRQAEEAFLKALDLDPNYTPARDNLARSRSGS